MVHCAANLNLNRSRIVLARKVLVKTLPKNEGVFREHISIDVREFRSSPA